MKRTVCAVATATLAASGLFVSAAQAADSDIFYGDIDPSKPRKIHIHKFESGSLEGPVTERKDDGQGDGVKGVPFKLYPIDVDLLTSAGWDKLSKVATVPAGACTATGAANWAVFTGPDAIGAKNAANEIEITTGDGGVATATDVPLGAYLVCEQDAAKPTNEAGHPVTVLKKAAPFIVTVPRPQADGNAKHTGWIYTVNAYPKNTVLESPKKATTINSVGLKVADGIEYTITTKVPNLLTDQHFKYFSLIDQMPAELKDAKVTSVLVGGNGVELNTHYTVDYDATKDFLAVNFTKAGLTHLKTKANTDVVVTIKATVDAVSGAQVANTAYFAVDTDSTPPVDEPPTPVEPQGPGKTPTPKGGNPPVKTSNKTATTWGDLKIRKHDVARSTEGLEGAQFQIFEAKDQGACTAAAAKPVAERYAEPNDDNAITVGTDTTFTTAKGGEITVAGLFIDKSDATADGEPSPKTQKCYVVKETRAPAGYVLPEENKRTFAVLVKAGTSVDADLDMPNTKVSVPALPLTGASGRVLLMVGGLALVLGSMGVVMVIRKRNVEA